MDQGPRPFVAHALLGGLLCIGIVFGIGLAVEPGFSSAATPAIGNAVRLATAGLFLAAMGLLVVAMRRYLDRLEAAMALRSDELARERELGNAILENAHDAIILCDVDGTIRAASASTTRMFGHTLGALVGTPLKRLIAPRHHRAYEAARARNLDAGRPLGLGRIVRFDAVAFDGSTFSVEAVFGAVPAAGGESVLGILRDTRERSLAREAIRRSESLRLLLDSLPDAVMVHDGTALLYVNRSSLAVLGYHAPQELLGRPLEDLLHPDDIPSVRQRLAQMDATQKPLPPAEERFLRRDGRAVTLEVAKVPVPFDGGRAIVAIGRDVSERHRADDRFRRAVESAPSGMLMVDGSGTIVLANRTVLEMFGYEADELVGAFVERLIPEPSRPSHPDLRREFLANPSARAMGASRELHAVRKDGSLFPVEIGLNPIEGDEGMMVLASVVDISERKKAEAVLALSDRMAAVGTLAAGVAHGINNPLAFVKGNVVWARREIVTLEESGALRHQGELAEICLALEQAEEGADRIRDIVCDLLKFSRKPEGPQESVDLHELLDSVLNMTRNEIRHRARITRRFASVPRIQADRSRLAHAFTNVLVNAAQAIPEGDARNNEIVVTVEYHQPGEVQVEIRDSGCGIEPEALDHVFEPFYTTKPVGSGTGLGLAICHAIVTSLEGAIAIESEVGRGTTVRIRLPAREAVETPSTPSPSETPRARRLLHVLVVDDEPRLLDAIRRLIGSEHRVVTASSAGVARGHLARGERFDVILCDLMMPDTTGMQLFEEIQALDPEQARRMVFVTGGAFTAAAREFIETVPNPCLMKPLHPDQLLETINEVAERSAAKPEDQTPR